MRLKSILLSLICAIGLSACSSSKEDAELKSASNIRIGMDIAFPPFEYMDNGQPAGFDVELMNQILKHSQLSAEYIDTRFYHLITGVKSNKFDVVISGLYITPERMKEVDMIPYYKTTQAVVVIKGGDYQPKTRGDLCGKKIATQKGTKYPEQLQQISTESCAAKGKLPIQILEFETSPQAIQAVLAKAADAEYDDIVALRLAVKNLSHRIEISSTDPFFPMFGGIVVRKGDQKTHQRILFGLEKMKQSGEYQRLLAHYGLEIPSDMEIADIYKQQ